MNSDSDFDDDLCENSGDVCYNHKTVLKQHEMEACLESDAQTLSDYIGVPLYAARYIVRKMGKKPVTIACDYADDYLQLTSNINYVDFFENGGKNECVVCCDEDNLLGLGCEHFFCSLCWMRHISCNLSNSISEIKCMNGENCNLIINDAQMKNNFPNSYHEYMQLIISEYAKKQKNPQFVRCQDQKCGSFIAVGNMSTVTCHCSLSFCMKCSLKPHEPLPCDSIKLLDVGFSNEKNVADETKSLEFLSDFGKFCPRCNIAVEKISGCNHINCTKCHTHFCYKCLVPFENNTYQHAYCEEKRNIQMLAPLLKKLTETSDKHLWYRGLHHEFKAMRDNLSDNFKDNLKNIETMLDKSFVGFSSIERDLPRNAFNLLLHSISFLAYAFPALFFTDDLSQRRLLEIRLHEYSEFLEEYKTSVVNIIMDDKLYCKRDWIATVRREMSIIKIQQEGLNQGFNKLSK